MPDIYENYNVFISSPGGLEAEREGAARVISNINKTIKETLKISLDSLMWEKLPPVTPALPEERIQDTINKEVEKSDFFILILHKRYGTTESGSNKSNTEREIDAILIKRQLNPNVKILAYFKSLGENDDQGAQETKARKLRERLAREGVFYRKFGNPDEFTDALVHDLYNVILKIRSSTAKISALQHFWKFSKVARNTHPHVAIIFQPVNREFMNHSGNENVWANRLQPNIYFEDYRTLHKIQNNLSLIGMNDYRVYFHTDIPPNLKDLNRIWICFPRNRRALDQLNKYDSAQLRFAFEHRRQQETRLKWKLPGRSKAIYIYSPLSKYLHEQRNSHDSSQDWTPDLGKVVAKDYAIIARFTTSNNDTGEGCLYDYYLAGIRGLGTWGASWFIDKKLKEIQKLPENENIQLLVEVSYRDGAIYDVKDVSDKSKRYFEDQNKIEVIKKEISAYRSFRY
jgi:hypothetical protein